MESSSESAELPPAYTPAVPAPASTLKRTIEDTRQMILANSWIMRGNMRIAGGVDIVIGKTRGPARASSGTRSFVSTTSNVTIRLRDESPAPQNQSVTPEPAPSDSERAAGKHYAALVAKETNSPMVETIILGEPQDTIEEALEWLLDRSEIMVTEILANHRRRAVATCCRACGQALHASQT